MQAQSKKLVRTQNRSRSPHQIDDNLDNPLKDTLINSPPNLALPFACLKASERTGASTISDRHLSQHEKVHVGRRGRGGWAVCTDATPPPLPLRSASSDLRTEDLLIPICFESWSNIINNAFSIQCLILSAYVSVELQCTVHVTPQQKEQYTSYLSEVMAVPAFRESNRLLLSLEQSLRLPFRCIVAHQGGLSWTGSIAHSPLNTLS